MRRVLFIAYLFPPIANSGTRRSLSFVNHLPDHGWEPLVLTIENAPVETYDEALLTEVRAGTRVERTPLGSAVVSRRLAGSIASGQRRERIAAGLEWRLRSLTGFPDEVASWYPCAVRRGVELHRSTGFDVVYASGWPWTAFLVARAIALQTGCPYVLDYRDLWKQTGTHDWETQNRLHAFVNPRLERIAARRAAAIVTVTPTLARVIARDAGVASVHCITNGYEPADFTLPSDSGRDPGANQNVFRIAYTGVWRPGYGLEDLYKAIRRLRDAGSPAARRIRVSAAGFKPGPAWDFGVAEFVDEAGMVPHDQAVALMRNADALYLPVPKGFYATASLPGKLFEYFGSERPILAMVPVDSEVARVINDVGGSLRLEPGDDAGLAHVLERLCEGPLADRFSVLRPDRLERYTRASTTAMLAKVLDAADRGIQLEPLS